jgi:uncharacterized protein DUF6090
MRKLRRNEITMNSKYLKYAIGEIALVAVGILLAVQINQWNTARANSGKEKDILAQIHAEFLENKVQLDMVVAQHQLSFDAVSELIGLFPINPAKMDTTRIAELMWECDLTYTFNPSEGSINALISTSSFDLIKNESLRIKLIQWNDMALDYREEEILAKEFRMTQMTPFFMKNFEYTEAFIGEKTNYEALTYLEFEGLLRVRLETLGGILDSNENELDNVRNAIDKIITLTALEN